METKDGNLFNAVPNMPIENRKKLYKEIKKEDYIGKMATIQYSTLSKLNTPQQPKFVTVRDYE